MVSRLVFTFAHASLFFVLLSATLLGFDVSERCGGEEKDGDAPENTLLDPDCRCNTLFHSLKSFWIAVWDFAIKDPVNGTGSETIFLDLIQITLSGA